MMIRKAEISDLENIMKMYNSCVGGMLKNGIDQWAITLIEKWCDFIGFGIDLLSTIYWIPKVSTAVNSANPNICSAKTSISIRYKIQ